MSADMPEIRDGLIIRPGDTLIVRYADANMTMERLAEIQRQLVARLPGLADVLIMAADEIAVYRP